VFPDLPTPCALVDREVVDRNTARMARRAANLGVRLRPHVKTHKCAEAARLQVRGHSGAITTSTIEAARWFAGQGFDDVTWAVPLSPGRLAEAMELIRGGCRLGLLLDDPAALAALEEAGGAQVVPVWLKVDCGYGRAGVDPDGDAGPALALRLHRSPRVDFRGVLAHAGHSYAAASVDEVRRIAGQERDVTVHFAERLRRAGIPVPGVSVGSTPTAVHAPHLRGVTEIRPGNYVFFDAFQAAIGSCELADVAFTVLTTVIGRHPDRHQLVLDAGALALSSDPGPVHVDPACGFGRLLDLDGQELPGLRLTRLSQEHGQARVEDPRLLDLLGIGDRLRVVPNHSCLSAALFTSYVVVERNTPIGQWLRSPLRPR